MGNKYKFNYLQQFFIIMVFTSVLISCGSSVNTQEQTNIEQTNMAIRVAELELEQTKEANRSTELALEQTKEAKNNNEGPEIKETINEPQVDVEATVNAAVEATRQAEIMSQPTEEPTLIQPTPDTRLFWNDFEDGISPEWTITGNNYRIVNNTFQSSGELTAFVGDSSWTDYSAEFVLQRGERWIMEDNLQIWIRHQPNSDHIELFVANWVNGGGSDVGVSVVRSGEHIKIPSGVVRIKSDLGNQTRIRIEAKGQMYKIYADGQQVLSFSDNNFTSGGVGIVSTDDAIILHKVTVAKLE